VRVAGIVLGLCLYGAAAGPVPGARADGDPASDVLQLTPLYTPLSQRVSRPVLEHLQGTIQAANAAGFKIRVALILDRTDLGAVPQLFGHPDAYVDLLAAELHFAWKGGVVAVQPAGVGVRNVTPLAAAERLVSHIQVATPASSDNLARAATTAVQELAAAAGYVIGSGAGEPAPASTSTISSTLTIVLPMLVASAGLALVGWRMNGRSEQGGSR
jgi:hypothetical protein